MKSDTDEFRDANNPDYPDVPITNGQKSIGFNDFDLIKVIGRGSYAKVKNKIGGGSFASKVFVVFYAKRINLNFMQFEKKHFDAKYTFTKI